MTSQDFRRLALSLPETSEQSHMEHPDFRVGGKIFATLGYPRNGWAMVKLTPEQQDTFMKAEPDSLCARKRWLGASRRHQRDFARGQENNSPACARGGLAKNRPQTPSGAAQGIASRKSATFRAGHDFMCAA